MPTFLDEFPNKVIVEFLAAGPKAYALWLKDPITGKDEYMKKCRGIMLNAEADAKLTFDRFRELVTNADHLDREDNYEEFDYREKNFRIAKQGEIFTVPLKKKLRPTYFKGVLRGERIVPFGYVQE